MVKKLFKKASNAINAGLKVGKQVVKNKKKKVKKFAKDEARKFGETAMKGAAMKAVSDAGKKIAPLGKALKLKSAYELAKTIPSTGFTGIALRNKDDIIKSVKHAGKQKGIVNKASTLGKSLLKTAAGVDPTKAKSTKKLLLPAAKNAVKRVGKDTMTMLDAGSSLPGPLGLKIRGVRTGVKTAGRAINALGGLAKNPKKLKGKGAKELAKGAAKLLAQEPRKLLSTFIE